MPVLLNNGQRAVAVPTAAVRRTAGRILKGMNRKGELLSILLTDNRKMTELHERWMGEPGPTDVLSFSGDGSVEVLGDVAISVEIAAQRARKRAGRLTPAGLQRQITTLLIHGALHLCGHDHHRPGPAARMRRQARRLARLLEGAA
ncbi:MAG: rRNA maturation RNase YbeY [Candidatus Omnitrophica bacterium CG11_big_fil_rev_8_21_14_0_20_64_10]|nr:MAG: rRNA maturation RNase YbeY [Candidatus Omnitrophica bacterium CG11_big_fil_rev_8_21_14_0_20_64_10]